MKTEWEHLLRTVVHGEYFLKRFIAEESGHGVFVASDAADVLRVARLVPAGDPAAEAFERHWFPLAGFSHPGLVQTLAYGKVQIDGELYLCSVEERPDDRLADLLPSRCLTAEETRAVLESTLPALHFLHERKYLHGAFGPESIVAVGEKTKLSTGTIQSFGDDRKQLAQEIRKVGQCVTTMLTPRGASKTAIPTEFAILLRTSAMADEKWSPTAADLLLALKGVDIGPEPEAPVVEAKPADVKAVDRKPVEIRPVEVKPVVPEPPRPKRRSVILEPPPPVVEPRKSYRLAVAALAVLIVLSSLVVMRMSDRNTNARAGSTPPAPEAQRSRADERVPINARPSAVTPAPVAAEPPKATRSERGRDWAVVAAIYKNQEAAQRRAEQLGKTWTDSKPVVLPSEPGARRYLVVVGSGLSQKEASALRSRAIAGGMPRDSYVTRLTW